MKDASNQRIVEKIFQFADLANKLVLEIGCGDGRITALMAGNAKKLVAVEPDAETIREARKKVSDADFLIGSGENLNFPDACFDLVIFTLSLHHQNSTRAIGEAIRVLKDEGTILVIEPINDGEIERLFALFRNENQATLEAQKSINESGLRLVRSEVFNAKWMFENKEELCQSIFNYYDLPFDTSIVVHVSDLLGAKLETTPIVLMDTMIIQSLKKRVS